MSKRPGFIHLEIRFHQTAELGPEPAAARGCGALQGQVPEEPRRVAAGTAEAAWLRVHWRGSACRNAAL